MIKLKTILNEIEIGIPPDQVLRMYKKQAESRFKRSSIITLNDEYGYYEWTGYTNRSIDYNSLLDWFKTLPKNKLTKYYETLLEF